MCLLLLMIITMQLQDILQFETAAGLDHCSDAQHAQPIYYYYYNNY